MFKVKRKPTQPRSTPLITGRCACCLGWPQMFASVGVYTPPDGGDPIAYALCPSCAQSATRGDKATIKAIETYLTEPTQPKRQPADQP